MINFHKFNLAKIFSGFNSSISKCTKSIIKFNLTQHSTMIIRNKSNTQSNTITGTGLFTKASGSVESTASFKEAPSIQGTDTFLNTLDILNDEEYLQNLFKQTHSRKLQDDFQNLQKENNKSDLILLAPD